MVWAAVAWALAVCSAAAQGLPETNISYKIDVTADPETGDYSGAVLVDWTNPGVSVVTTVPLHLYLNAFSNGSSTWLRERGLGRFDTGAGGQAWGFTEPVEPEQGRSGVFQRVVQTVEPEPLLTPDGEPDPAYAEDDWRSDPYTLTQLRQLRWKPVQPDDENPHDRSLIEVALAEPVGPGETLSLTIYFTGRLPTPPIARTGCVEDFCFFGQWYPQIGAYETKGVRGAVEDGWAAGQFHGPTEFYNNFADFEVTITAPERFEVAATGRRIAETDADDGMRSTTWSQRAVTNFAFVVAELEEFVDTHDPEGPGGEVEITLVAPPGLDLPTDRAFKAVKGSLDVFGSRIGPYPYDTVTVVYPPVWGGAIGGMEYPTLFTGIFVDPIFEHPLLKDFKGFELVDIHEFGHQYFMGLIATNEREEAFMDEGFNTYWELETLEALYGEESSYGALFGRPLSGEHLVEQQNKDANAEFREGLAKQPSHLFLPGTGGSQIYNRPGATLQTAEKLFGEGALDAVFQEYYRRFAFDHPGTDDFFDTVRDVAGDEMEAFLREGFFAPRSPDYSVERARSTRTSVPAGRYVKRFDEIVEVTPENSVDALEWWLSQDAYEIDGRAVVEVREGGFDTTPGAVEHVAFEIDRGAAAADHETDVMYTSYVRLGGSAWETLPVEVVFTFSDGAVVRDVWDGRSVWRSYEFVRPGRLLRVETDPEGKIMIDADPTNDAVVLEIPPAATAEAQGWSAFIGGLFGVLANGAGAFL
ncbi:MAG: M1 family metallopeptidase [Pseudomonadota bacterium]